MGPLGYEMENPLFNVRYDDLLLDLEKSQLPCIVSAVSSYSLQLPITALLSDASIIQPPPPPTLLQVGTIVFNRQQVEALEKTSIASFGENGGYFNGY